MEDIRNVMVALYRQEITDDEAEKRLGKIDPESLGEFIVDAFNRGWISPFNLGINIDGTVD